MAKKRGIGNIQGETERFINMCYNDLIQIIVDELPDVSPKDTGFFASSWKASTQRPQARDEKKDFTPWSGYKQGAMKSDVKPRHKVPTFNYKKQPTVYIGNTVLYATSALASKKSSIPQYVQGEMGRLVAETFREYKAGRIFALTGQQGVSPVGYTRFGENPL